MTLLLALRIGENLRANTFYRKLPRTYGTFNSIFPVLTILPSLVSCAGIKQFHSTPLLLSNSITATMSSTQEISNEGTRSSLPTIVRETSGPWKTVLEFWFPEGNDEGVATMQKWWFQGSETLDQTIQQKFADLVEEAGNGGLLEWENETLGCLAKIILLDQFTRNIYRGKPEAFQYDKVSQNLSVRGIDAKMWESLPETMRMFALMPLMHAEDKTLQERSVDEFGKLSMYRNSPALMKFATDHRDAVVKFGRFPHRNSILGRESTDEEIEFLKTAETYGQTKK